MGLCSSFNRRNYTFLYLLFCSAAAGCNRLRSCATCTMVVTVRAEIEDKISPPIAPKAGVNGHAYFKIHLLNLRASLKTHLPRSIPVKGNGYNANPAPNNRAYSRENNGALYKISSAL